MEQFPSKIITDQCRNFECELIQNLCQVAGVKNLRTIPYHPQTNGQCEHFNNTLLNMLGTLTAEQKKDWKSHVPALVHTYNCTKNVATGFSSYYLLFGREPRLPVDVEFGLQRGSQKGSLGESSYISQLKRSLRFANNKAKQMAKRQQAKYRELYDQKCRGAELKVGDLVLVKQTAWKGRHKIWDRWESEEYQVVGQPSPGVPVYTVKSVAGGMTRVLHRNLLLPLQERIRQEGGMREEGISGSEDEEERGDEIPKVARALCWRPRGTTRPKASPSQQREASGKDACADLSGQKTHSLLASPSFPEHMSGDEDSSKDEVYTDSFTSHTTASDSSTADLLTSSA